MIRLVLVGAMLVAGPVWAAPAEGGVKGAWVRINPAPGRPSAGYFAVTNGVKADALVGAEVPGARVEMHTMTMDGGVMRMSPVARVPLKAGETVAFKPGGYHLMIYGLAAPGKAVAMTLVFASGAKVAVQAEVRAAADPHVGH